MRRVILASHHNFAQGLADTLEFLGNDVEVNVICAYTDERPLQPQVDALFSSFLPEDEVIILTDILQGSVNQAFAPHMGPHTFLVAGVNVPLALELCLCEGPLSTELIEDAIALAKQSFCLVNNLVIEDGEDDE